MVSRRDEEGLVNYNQATNENDRQGSGTLWGDKLEKKNDIFQGGKCSLDYS